MNKTIITIVLSSGLLLLAGCQGGGIIRPDTTTESAATATGLTSEASQSLAQAEVDTKEAASKEALWIPAQKALKKARAAAKQHDSTAVIKYARKASELARLGIKQLSYPLVH